MNRRRVLQMLTTLTLASPLVIASTLPAWAQQPTAGQAAAPSVQGPKKRLAILEFDFDAVSHWWGSDDWNVGRGISDLLVNSLVQDGTYSLIERKRLDEVLKEQQFSNSSAADPHTANQLSKLLGVNALVTGSVTQFGFDDKSVGLGGFGARIGGGMFGGLSHKESKAIVVVTARLIDPTTGEILCTAQGKGESKRGSWGGFGAGWGHNGVGGGGIDMSSSNFQNTILGEATQKCIDALAAQIIAQQARVVGTKLDIHGKVADVDGASIILNIGKDSGISVGDTLSIVRVVRTVKDPDTGKVIREVTEPLGTIHISSVDADSSTGTFSGTGVPKIGDRVTAQ